MPEEQAAINPAAMPDMQMPDTTKTVMKPDDTKIIHGLTSQAISCAPSPKSSSTNLAWAFKNLSV